MCAVKWMLGFPCPGCGLMHALWAVVHLQWKVAFVFFPIWPVFILFVVLRRNHTVGRFFLGALLVQWMVRMALALHLVEMFQGS